MSLFRKPAPEGLVADPSLWTILIKGEDGTFKENDVMIPCDRIAYALFYAMRIQVTPEALKEVIAPLQPLNGPEGEMKNNYFKVEFIRRVEGFLKRELVSIEADTVSDALTRAKFHFETSEDWPYGDILPEELSILHEKKITEIMDDHVKNTQ